MNTFFSVPSLQVIFKGTMKTKTKLSQTDKLRCWNNRLLLMKGIQRANIIRKTEERVATPEGLFLICLGCHRGLCQLDTTCEVREKEFQWNQGSLLLREKSSWKLMHIVNLQNELKLFSKISNECHAKITYLKPKSREYTRSGKHSHYCF